MTLFVYKMDKIVSRYCKILQSIQIYIRWQGFWTVMMLLTVHR